MAGRRPVRRADGAEHGRQHQPAGDRAQVGRAVPLAFLLAAVGVLLVAYGSCGCASTSSTPGSVYAFVGATLGPRTGVVSGWGLLGTYTFYGVVTSIGRRHLRDGVPDQIGVWPHPPTWAPFVLAAVALALALLLAIVPAKRGTTTSC